MQVKPVYKVYEYKHQANCKNPKSVKISLNMPTTTIFHLRETIKSQANTEQLKQSWICIYKQKEEEQTLNNLKLEENIAIKWIWKIYLWTCLWRREFFGEKSWNHSRLKFILALNLPPTSAQLTNTATLSRSTYWFPKSITTQITWIKPKNQVMPQKLFTASQINNHRFPLYT